MNKYKIEFLLDGMSSPSIFGNRIEVTLDAETMNDAENMAREFVCTTYHVDDPMFWGGTLLREQEK